MGPVTVVVLVVVVVATSSSGRSFGECEFTDPDCGWKWSEAWNLLSAQNLTVLNLGTTAPAADAQNNVKGLFLYWSAREEEHLEIEYDKPKGLDDKPKYKLEIMSPLLEAHTLPTCGLQMSLHMYNMDPARFSVVIKALNNSWESTRFFGTSAHTWETQIQPIGLQSKPFNVILEIIYDSRPVFPSHIAVDDIQIIRCYEKKKISTDCRGRQFQCYDLICIEGSGVCDITPQCTTGEDEEQDCDKLPESAYCTFENGMCGWVSNDTETGKWILRRGEEGKSRTGPTVDHTYRNETGTFLMARFPPGRTFGNQVAFTSPWFAPPPYYHRNVHSAYFNSCQVRFHFHKFGNNMGELRMYTLELDQPGKPRLTDLWRSYGNKGDVWWNAVVSLPNMTNIYQIQFVASRGMGQSDISIDDLTLSPECFGIGVPENESIAPANEYDAASDRSVTVVQKYEFNTCGARGRYGPNETMCSAVYQDTQTKVMVMKEPTLEGVQRWIVPESGIYTIFVNGAGGGNGMAWRDNERSMGTFIRATFDWEAGEVIYFLIGQKGSSVCDEQKPLCATGISKDPGGGRLDSLEVLKRMKPKDAGGGGGGATYIFTINPITQNRHPIVIAGGGGGLAARLPNDTTMTVSPHGLPQNASILPINGYTGSGAGGGGGWDDNTIVPTGGWSLREGGRGGESCKRVFDSEGGFGGGGGGCQSGGGGGGYRGGDAAETDNPYHNGQGGTSFLHAGALRVLVQPGSNPGDGSVVILPAQEGCGCEYRCVYLDLSYRNSYCICPPPLTINMDGFSCNGRAGVSVSPKVLVVIIVSVVLLISVAVICIFYGFSKYRKIHRVSRDVSDEPLNSPEEQLSRLRSSGGMISENNPNYEFGGNTCTEQDLKKVSREQLTLVKALGQGAFGEVYEGYLTNPTDSSEQPVAVKTLPELSSSQAIFDFLMEALIMSKFNHPNIVSFIGVCFEKMPRFIVLELLPGGDLKSFLRECRPKPNKPSSLTVTDLLMLALDVAKGCQYLEENHFIHRDIAARNCLLTTKDANRVVKIADFGMARDIYRADYYRKGGKAMLPVKWMPPEAFLDGIFTSKTDVWSFGVLLWEVISLGYMPYPGRGNQEVMQLVTSGGRLEPPTNCPGPVYHVMMQCWHPHPDERPNFTTIIERLGYCLQDPDVINAPLPIFNRAPSMERDATVMRPVEDESGGCLQVQRPDPGLLLSPGSEDYLIPNHQSSYSLTTELQSSPSQGSADQLLELEERSKSPSTRPTVWETNFTGPDPPLERKPRGSSHPPMKRQDGYTEIPTEETEAQLKDEEVDCLDKIQQNGYVASGVAARKSSAARMSSIKSLDDLPVAPKVGENENNTKNPDNTSSKHRSNLSLDPRALVRQMSGSEPTNLPPNRYVNVDVNCNTGDSNSSLSRVGLGNRNSVTGPFDGYSGVNPVA